jgi:hypothetical protein
VRIKLSAEFELSKNWINEKDSEELRWFIDQVLPHSILIFWDQEEAGDAIVELAPGEFEYKVLNVEK